MTLMLDLAPDVEAQLRERASEEGRGAEAVAQALLREGLHLPPMEATDTNGHHKTMADFLEGYIGVVNSGGKEALSENCGEKFTDYLVEKRRQGRL